MWLHLEKGDIATQALYNSILFPPRVLRNKGKRTRRWSSSYVQKKVRRKSPFHSIANICLHGCLHTYKRERFIHFCIPCSSKPSFRQSVTSTFVYRTNDEWMNAWSLFVAELAQVAGLSWGCCLTCGPAEAALWVACHLPVPGRSFCYAVLPCLTRLVSLPSGRHLL